MNKLTKYTEYFMMAEFMKAKLEVSQKENGREGVDFIVKTDSGDTHELYLQTINVEEKKSISILKSDLGEPKDNLWIALVLLMDGINPTLYLIPSSQLTKPDDYIFFDSNQKGSLSHFSSWRIKVFTKGIMGKLSEYLFVYQVENLI
jgi:hypothetical protein